MNTAVSSGLVIIFLSISQCWHITNGQGSNQCRTYGGKSRDEYCREYAGFCKTKPLQQLNMDFCTKIPEDCGCAKITPEDNNVEYCKGYYTSKSKDEYCRDYEKYCKYKEQQESESNRQFCNDIPAYCGCPRIIVKDVKVENYPKEILQNMHNDYREKVSKGLVWPQPAGHIPPMKWNQDLAVKAYNWAKQCNQGSRAHNPDKMFFDKSTNLNMTVGENWASNPYYDLEVMFTMWINESFDYDYTNNRAKGGKVIGHYTQIVWDDSVILGCGLAVCPYAKYKYNLICNYILAGNYNKRRPYQPTEAEHKKVCCEGYDKYCAHQKVNINQYCIRQHFCGCGNNRNNNNGNSNGAPPSNNRPAAQLEVAKPLQPRPEMRPQSDGPRPPVQPQYPGSKPIQPNPKPIDHPLQQPGSGMKPRPDHPRPPVQPERPGSKPVQPNPRPTDHPSKPGLEMKPRPNRPRPPPIRPQPKPKPAARPAPVQPVRPKERPVQLRPSPKPTGNRGYIQRVITRFHVVLRKGVAKIVCRAKPAEGQMIYLYLTNGESVVNEFKSNLLRYKERNIVLSKNNTWKCVVRGEKNGAEKDEVQLSLMSKAGVEPEAVFHFNKSLGYNWKSRYDQKSYHYPKEVNDFNELTKPTAYICTDGSTKRYICYVKRAYKFVYTFFRNY